MALTFGRRASESGRAGRATQGRAGSDISDGSKGGLRGARLAPGHVIKITRQGDHLYAQRLQGKNAELLAESIDLFFRAGVEGRYLFHHDASGHVDMLIDRRNNEDLLWKRVN